MTSKTSPTISGSSALVGSSNNNTSGSIHKARAIATRCFCPPESLVLGLFANSFIPTSSKNFKAVAFASSFDFFKTRIWPNIQFSKTVKLLNKLKL